MPLHLSNALCAFSHGALSSRINWRVIAANRKQVKTVPFLRPLPSDPVQQGHAPPDSLCSHRVIAITRFHQLSPLSSFSDLRFGRQGVFRNPCPNRPFGDHQRIFDVFHVPHDFPRGSRILEPEQVANVFDCVQWFNHADSFNSSSTETPRAADNRLRLSTDGVFFPCS